MICPKCGVYVEDGSVVCEACGAPLVEETKSGATPAKKGKKAKKKMSEKTKKTILGILGAIGALAVISFIVTICLTVSFIGKLNTADQLQYCNWYREQSREVEYESWYQTYTYEAVDYFKIDFYYPGFGFKGQGYYSEDYDNSYVEYKGDVDSALEYKVKGSKKVIIDGTEYKVKFEDTDGDRVDDILIITGEGDFAGEWKTGDYYYDGPIMNKALNYFEAGVNKLF